MQRIGGGTLRGRVLSALPRGVAGLRPTGSRVRGAIFDRLQTDVIDARVLDLFAGSGALSFEALSRGASAATMLDTSPKVVAHLRKQAQTFGVARACEVINIDALRYLRNDRLPEQPTFDLVFVDPPFATPEVFDPVVARLAAGGWLSPDALVVCEFERVRGKRLTIAWPEGIELELSRAYGQAHVEIARSPASPAASPNRSSTEATTVSDVPISTRAQRIKPSATLAVSGRAKQLRAEGKQVLNFAAGEPDFSPPKAVCDAMVERSTSGPVGYAPVPGTPQLRAAVAAELSAVHGRTFEPTDILVSCGAKHSLANLFLATCEAGDEVVIAAPYWVSYPDMIGLAEATPVVVTTSAETGLRMTPELLEPVLSSRTKMIVINSPCNPTGVGYTAEHIRALGEVIAKKAPQAWIVVDDIYRKLVYDGYQHASAFAALDGLTDRVIVVDGVSKTYAMTGFRIGFLAAPKPLIAAASRIQSQTTSGAATMSQQAALVAITDPSVAADTAAMHEAFTRRRTIMLDGLAAAPGVSVIRPDGAFYAFANVAAHCGEGTAYPDDVALATWLLEEKLVASVPGTPFGAPGHLRLSYATDDATIQEGLSRIAQALASLPTA